MHSKPSSLLKFTGLIIVLIGLVGGYIIGHYVEPQWEMQYTSLDMEQDDSGMFYVFKGKRTAVDQALESGGVPTMLPQQVDGKIVVDEQGDYYRVTATRHLGIWSLLPAFMAIGLCLATREPLVSLLMGIVSGALMLQQYDLTEEVLMPSLASTSSAGVLLLYLWLLGGLMGVWSRTGATRAFAQWATQTLVRGPRTAKLVAWGLGILFFQGGNMSAVLAGTCVKPIADDENISHEELSYIIDSTASPIAILMAFNAWPAYVQALIYVPGVAVLATETDRLGFFFRSLPLSFYAIFAILSTFLLCIDKPIFIGKQMREAIKRSRETGQLDREDAQPLSSPELRQTHVPEGYTSSLMEFVIPLLVMIVTAIGTFIATGSPQVRWAFAFALLTASVMALVRGMALDDLMEGIATGLKGVVMASVILLLAVALGSVTKQMGGGAYLVSQLSGTLPYWLLPVALMLLTMCIAFATGTSWGTFAVTFPLAMPLAWALANESDLNRPVLYLMICFASVLNGSVYGDQCSPISDTTILSSMTCGADLMDHVKTQLIPASIAAFAAMVCWEVMVLGLC
ncbi:MAG TPA: sodium:proton antiporter [Phycisphaerales bacterium]|nr:sodium:proton antiporter [Phycisphaerales bacterium]HCD34397.1 sodium:proton antiporter [Phycisphaerales bacterium]|tara:strand:+ start:650 stop:2359 length:1710 start_codon:yes stop_codon:yes gene_type:complete